MTGSAYDKEITAFVVIVPYNNFISEGGKLRDRIRYWCRSEWLRFPHAGSRESGASGEVPAADGKRPYPR